MKLCIKIFMIALIFTGCDKDKPTCQGINCLPPATQTGAGTFGCLVNGEPYVDNSGRFNCFYQLVNGKYYFGIASTKDYGSIQQLVILSYMKEIDLNVSIPLDDRANGNFFSEIAFDCICPNGITTSTVDGLITFTKMYNKSKYCFSNF